VYTRARLFRLGAPFEIVLQIHPANCGTSAKILSRYHGRNYANPSGIKFDAAVSVCVFSLFSLSFFPSSHPEEELIREQRLPAYPKANLGKRRLRGRGGQSPPRFDFLRARTYAVRASALLSIPIFIPSLSRRTPSIRVTREYLSEIVATVTSSRQRCIVPLPLAAPRANFKSFETFGNAEEAKREIFQSLRRVIAKREI